MKPLIAPGVLLRSSWETFVKMWNVMVKYSAWYMLTGILMGASMIFPQGNSTLGASALLLTSIVNILVAVWASACMLQVALANEAGNAIVAELIPKHAWVLIPSLVWVGFLNGLASLGAFLLLILPGIYVAVRLGFGTISVIDINVKGRAALARSWALTKDRFWAVLGRQAVGALVFGVGIAIVTMIASLIVGLVAGGAKVDILLSASSQDPTQNGISTMFNSIIQAAFIPLILIFQTKLYRSLVEAQQP